MKQLVTNIFRLALLVSFASQLPAQVTCEPVFPNVDDDVTIYYDATQGNAALIGVSPVYAHMGVITNLSTSPTDWKHVTTTWGIADPVGAMQANGTNMWKKTINIRTFFNIQPGETVLKLAFVFRNTAGSTVGRAADGSDIYYEVFPDNGPLQTLLLKPTSSAFLTSTGTSIPVKAAASKTATLNLYDNGALVTATTGELLQTTLTAAAGSHQIVFTADATGETDTVGFLYVVPSPVVVQDPPAGTQPGITYLDDQSARLVLYAPNKEVVYAVGDFSDWQPQPAYQMKRSADNTTWWIDLTNLPPNQPVRFQYWVDGTLRIADPLSTLVLDPYNDAYIPPFTYPNMPPYPAGKTTGIVSVLQTAQPPFVWTTPDYQKPAKANLVIYELLARDFVARHDFQTIRDTLDYLQRLGVTAIELMPVNEFGGNISWGYNPSYHKSLDKYYGDANALKLLVDECHSRGLAVILDVVFNQASGESPLAQLYWDVANNRPAANNPWLNPVAKHDFNVFNDFNHESPATKVYVKNCLQYWLQEFHVDGFRFDLSKGFTQKNTVGNVGLWGQYDASRVAILKDYANTVWGTDPTAYVILEHFAENTEEKELAEYGMMLWGNMNGAYKEVALGYTAGINASLSAISYKQRGWNVPHLIGYMESHDEERIEYECRTNGNAQGAYNIKNYFIALKRIELLNNLLYTVPGPKMLWQFGELGYDFPINYCENGNIDPGCRISPKPIRWDYFAQPARRRLYDATAALLQLRKSQELFQTTNFQTTLGGGQFRSVRLDGTSLNAIAAANIGMTPGTTTISFQHTGTYYDYYTGTSLNVPNTSMTLFLNPGEYRLYLDQFIPVPAGLNPTPVREVVAGINEMEIYPNPAVDRAVLALGVATDLSIQLTVTDMTGRVIFRRDALHLLSGDNLMEIETNSWKPGVYLLTNQSANGGIQTLRLVKGL